MDDNYDVAIIGSGPGGYVAAIRAAQLGLKAGAYGIRAAPIRLPHEVAPLFRAWLDAHHPDRAAKVMATINSLRGGGDNDGNFFTRFAGEGPWSELMRTRLRIAKRKNGLTARYFELRTDLFRRPSATGQLSLL